MESKEWKKVIARYESDRIQDRLAGVSDEFTERGVSYPLKYEHMIPVILTIVGNIYAHAYSVDNLTGVMYRRNAVEIHDRITRYPKYGEESVNIEENHAIWSEIRDSMPDRLKKYSFKFDLAGNLFLKDFTVETAEDFLDYLESKAFDDMMKRIRRSRMIIPKPNL